MKRTMAEVKRQNKALGHRFFDKQTLQFFGSRIESNLFRNKYFITSEQPPHGHRVYTVRVAEPDGFINTPDEIYGEKNWFPHELEARRYMKAQIDLEAGRYINQ